VLNYRLITDEGPTSTSTVTYLIPLVALTLGWLILDEVLTWPILLGAAVVLSGVALSEGRFHVRAGMSERVHKRPSVTR
jgi:drug/metabolite transporter (DMT)-like permease